MGGEEGEEMSVEQKEGVPDHAETPARAKPKSSAAKAFTSIVIFFFVALLVVIAVFGLFLAGCSRNR